MSSSKLGSSSAIFKGHTDIHIQSTLDITVICNEGLYFICTHMTNDDYTSFEEEIVFESSPGSQIPEILAYY